MAITNNEAHGVLAEVLSDLAPYPEMVQETLDELEELLNGNLDLVETGGGIIMIESSLPDTLFAYEYNQQDFLNPDFTMPTVDFYEILIEWKNYLDGNGNLIIRFLLSIYKGWISSLLGVRSKQNHI